MRVDPIPGRTTVSPVSGAILDFVTMDVFSSEFSTQVVTCKYGTASFVFRSYTNVTLHMYASSY